MDFNDKRFGGSQNRNNRDRTVPPEENYYGRVEYDLNFNNRTEYSRYEDPENGRQNRKPSDGFQDVYSNSRRRDAYRYDDVFSEGGRNPADEYYRSRPQRQSRPEPSGKGKKKKKKRSKLSPVIAVLSILIVIVLIVSVSGFSVLAKMNYSDKIANAYVSSGELVSSSDVKNVLLLGVDARAGEDGETSRSDTMMLISVDSANNCIKLTSFLRDTWVYIPCKDFYSKLNSACAYGGYSGVVDTIEYNFGVDIDGYVVADFELFTIMVDSIGGVEVEVTQAEADEVTNHPGRYGDVTLEAGKYMLTGQQALAYCRIRKIDTDWARTQRQRTVMEAILKRALRAGPFTAYGMISDVAPYIETDLSQAQIISLGIKTLGCVSGGFKQQSCPFDGTWEYATRSGASVIAINLDENRQQLAEFIYGE